VDLPTARLASQGRDYLRRVWHFVPACELVRLLQQRWHPIRAVHAANELGSPRWINSGCRHEQWLLTLTAQNTRLPSSRLDQGGADSAPVVFLAPVFRR
jgi:hypothetical protein